MGLQFVLLSGLHKHRRTSQETCQNWRAGHLAVGMEGMFEAEGEAVKCKEASPPFRLSALNPLSATY